MHAVAVPKGVLVLLPLYIQCSTSSFNVSFMQAGGGVRTSIVGFLLTTYSTTWGQGLQPSSSRSECFGFFGANDVV